MKSLSKKSISIFLIFTMLIALILPTIVNAEGESYTITYTATDKLNIQIKTKHHYLKNNAEFDKILEEKLRMVHRSLRCDLHDGDSVSVI